MAVRNSIQDFMRDVRLRGLSGGTSSNVYTAALNADNTTCTISKNGAVLFSKVLWPGTGAAAQTDASGGGNQDTVDIFDGSGFYSAGGAQAFINGLT